MDKNGLATDLTDSEATTISFKLNADITNGSTDSNYFVYFGYPYATAYSTATAEDSYNVGSANATLVVPFNGDTTGVNAETPSTSTGAIRYSGPQNTIRFS